IPDYWTVRPGFDSVLEQGLLIPDQMPGLGVVEKLLELSRRHGAVPSKYVSRHIISGSHAPHRPHPQFALSQNGIGRLPHDLTRGGPGVVQLGRPATKPGP